MYLVSPPSPVWFSPSAISVSTDGVLVFRTKLGGVIMVDLQSFFTQDLLGASGINQDGATGTTIILLSNENIERKIYAVIVSFKSAVHLIFIEQNLGTFKFHNVGNIIKNVLENKVTAVCLYRMKSEAEIVKLRVFLGDSKGYLAAVDLTYNPEIGYTFPNNNVRAKFQPLEKGISCIETRPDEIGVCASLDGSLCFFNCTDPLDYTVLTSRDITGSVVSSIVVTPQAGSFYYVFVGRKTSSVELYQVSTTPLKVKYKCSMDFETKLPEKHRWLSLSWDNILGCVWAGDGSGKIFLLRGYGRLTKTCAIKNLFNRPIFNLHHYVLGHGVPHLLVHCMDRFIYSCCLNGAWDGGETSPLTPPIAATKKHFTMAYKLQDLTQLAPPMERIVVMAFTDGSVALLDILSVKTNITEACYLWKECQDVTAVKSHPTFSSVVAVGKRDGTIGLCFINFFKRSMSTFISIGKLRRHGGEVSELVWIQERKDDSNILISGSKTGNSFNSLFYTTIPGLSSVSSNQKKFPTASLSNQCHPRSFIIFTTDNCERRVYTNSTIHAISSSTGSMLLLPNPKFFGSPEEANTENTEEIAVLELQNSEQNSELCWRCNIHKSLVPPLALVKLQHVHRVHEEKKTCLVHLIILSKRAVFYHAINDNPVDDVIKEFTELRLEEGEYLDFSFWPDPVFQSSCRDRRGNGSSYLVCLLHTTGLRILDLRFTFTGVPDCQTLFSGSFKQMCKTLQNNPILHVKWLTTRTQDGRTGASLYFSTADGSIFQRPYESLSEGLVIQEAAMPMTGTSLRPVNRSIGDCHHLNSLFLDFHVSLVEGQIFNVMSLVKDMVAAVLNHQEPPRIDQEQRTTGPIALVFKSVHGATIDRISLFKYLTSPERKVLANEATCHFCETNIAAQNIAAQSDFINLLHPLDKCLENKKFDYPGILPELLNNMRNWDIQAAVNLLNRKGLALDALIVLRLTSNNEKELFLAAMDAFLTEAFDMVQSILDVKDVRSNRQREFDEIQQIHKYLKDKQTRRDFLDYFFQTLNPKP